MVAAENVRVTRLVEAFTEQVYNRQMELLRTGNAAAFEASALRAVVGQVRANQVQARSKQSLAHTLKESGQSVQTQLPDINLRKEVFHELMRPEQEGSLAAELRENQKRKRKKKLRH